MEGTEGRREPGTEITERYADCFRKNAGMAAKTVAFFGISVTMFKDNLIMRDYYEFER